MIHQRGSRARGVMRFLVAALAALLLVPAAAQAHPLGNFSVNHLSQVSVSSDRVEVRYLLDVAEIPTFQKSVDGPAEVAKRLTLTVDGRATHLIQGAPTITYPPGQGGLPTTRVVIDLGARVNHPRKIVLHDDTFPGRVGWKAVGAKPGRDTATKSSAPADDPTNGLRRYPKDLLKSPSDLRTATLSVRPGHGTLQAPGAHRIETGTTVDGFAGILADGHRVLLV